MQLNLLVDSRKLTASRLKIRSRLDHYRNLSYGVTQTRRWVQMQEVLMILRWKDGVLVSRFNEAQLLAGNEENECKIRKFWEREIDISVRVEGASLVQENSRCAEHYCCKITTVLKKR